MRPTLRLLRSLDSSFSTAQAIKQNCHKVVCIGRNYAEHAAELDNAPPSTPFFFLKPPSSILHPNEGPIIRPRGIELHHEVELGLVIGRPVKDLEEEDVVGAMGSIACYILAIDLTARNLQSALKARSYPWTIAKGFDTFLPITHPFSPSSFPSTLPPHHPSSTPPPHAASTMLHNPYTAHLTLSITSPPGPPVPTPTTTVRQSDSASLMLFRIPRVLSEISRVMGLEAGDVVLTGTPKGVGSVKGGDRVSVGCEIVEDGKRRRIQEASAEWEVEDAKKEGVGGLYEFKG